MITILVSQAYLKLMSLPTDARNITLSHTGPAQSSYSLRGCCTHTYAVGLVLPYKLMVTVQLSVYANTVDFITPQRMVDVQPLQRHALALGRTFVVK